MDKRIVAITPVRETELGLFGVAVLDKPDRTLICNGKKVLDPFSLEWRSMTELDVAHMRASGCIAEDVADRQQMRVMR